VTAIGIRHQRLNNFQNLGNYLVGGIHAVSSDVFPDLTHVFHCIWMEGILHHRIEDFRAASDLRRKILGDFLARKCLHGAADRFVIPAIQHCPETSQLIEVSGDGITHKIIGSAMSLFRNRLVDLLLNFGGEVDFHAFKPTRKSPH
jgi:hypothetical protein